MFKLEMRNEEGEVRTAMVKRVVPRCCWWKMSSTV